MSEERNITYIGITGLAGSGKDTFAKFLMHNTGDHVISHRVALADPLKRTASEMYGVALSNFYNRELKEEPIEMLSGMTPRTILQQFGTEVVRHMNQDHWVNRFSKEVEDVVETFYESSYDAEYSIRTISDINYSTRSIIQNRNKMKNIYNRNMHTPTIFNLIVVPDIRFENEISMILNKGGRMVDIKRENLDVGEMSFEHSSESSIPNMKGYAPHFEIQNTTLSSMELSAIAILNKMGLR